MGYAEKRACGELPQALFFVSRQNNCPGSLFFFRREVPVKYLCRLLVHIVPLGRVVDACDSVQESRTQLLEQKIGDDLLLRLSVIADAPRPGHYKAGFSVKVQISLNAQRTCTQFRSLFHGTV